MTFARNALNYLRTWRDQARRKPLVIRGARQVGKSTLVHLFGLDFDQFIGINFEKEKEYRDLFETVDDIHSLWDTLQLRMEISASEEGVLLFLDEIQASPKAISMLRYFYEDYPKVAVIAAGSLLEFALSDIESFPVGRVENYVLHPLDFGEFLHIKGHTKALEAWSKIPVAKTAHTVLLRYFHEYARMGGMPEIVARSLEGASAFELASVYDDLWFSYSEDVEKYARNNNDRSIIRHVLASAAHEKDRIAFSGFGNSTYLSRDVGAALRSLQLARILRMIYPTTDIVPPAIKALRKRPRLQFLDVGLLNHALGISGEFLTIKDFSDAYRGRIIQQLVTQDLIAQHHKPSFDPVFWVRDKNNSSAEVDLVYPYRELLIPIELKSGAAGKLRSLHEFMDRCDHQYAVRMLANEFSIDNLKTPKGKAFLLMNLPYYLGGKLPEYLGYFVAKL